MSLTNYKYWKAGGTALSLTDDAAGEIIERESGFLEHYTTGVDALTVLTDPAAALAQQKVEADKIHAREGKAAVETADFLLARGWTSEDANRAALIRHGKRAKEDIALQSMARPLVNNLDLLIDAGLGRSVGNRAIEKLATGVPALEASKSPGKAAKALLGGKARAKTTSTTTP
eukprot:TRINITY_DN4602_c1_g1_i1.p1 TRINITY_DN4602_c1_g1~~TRINITY_DN4602_c1_g1_i1.p1  ORF type:complete len:174 (+),score=27.79 TRINITY_DN4602_c1_g1_i1:36-557(+)